MSEVRERPTVQEIAKDLAELCRQGRFMEPGDKYWADDVVSLEVMPGDMARIQGKAGVRAKGEWWTANHEIHGVEVQGPYVFGDQFVVRFSIDVTPKGGQRTSLDEAALYTVKDGKIAEERFFRPV